MRALVVLGLLLLPQLAAAHDRWPQTGNTFGTWFSSMSLFDERMRSAVNQATYEWHHYAVEDDGFLLVDANTWGFLFDPATGTCTSGGTPILPQFVYDFGSAETCENGPGGGAIIGEMCRCVPNSSSTYGGSTMAYEEQPAYWTLFTSVAPPTADAYAYPTDIQNVSYPKPLARLDFLAAAACVAVENVNKPVVFQSRDNPVIYVETTPWNYSARTQAERLANVADSLIFIGWKKDDVSAASRTPSLATYIDPAVAGTAALIEANLVDAFGFMWTGTVWRWAVIRNSVIVQDVLALDPVARFGSMANYLDAHTGGSTAFMVQTDIDGTYARRRGAFQVTDHGSSTNVHSQYVPFTVDGTGVIDSGFADVGGVGQNYHRVVQGCLRTGSVETLGRFFFSQMDIVK